MLVMSVFVYAAIRSGGTALAPSSGTRIEERDRRRRTVVVWMLTLLSLVLAALEVGMLGSGRWRDLADSSISGLRANACSVRYK